MTLHKTRKAFTALMLATVLLGGTASYAGSAQAAAPDTIQGKVTEVRPARTHEEKIAEWEAWAADHAYKLDSIQPVGSNGKPDSFQDLEMLKPLLQDKRFVFLGESSHGVAEFNLAKTRLIQFLHQELGYNVLAFESGLALPPSHTEKSAAAAPSRR